MGIMFILQLPSDLSYPNRFDGYIHTLEGF